MPAELPVSGFAMTSMSKKSAGKIENKYKVTGKESVWRRTPSCCQPLLMLLSE